MTTQAELLTVGDVAKLMGVAPSTVRVWAYMGRLSERGRTAGGIRLFDRSDVEAFAKARAAAPRGGTRS